MNKNILHLAIAITTLVSCNGTNDYKLNGKFEDCTNETIYLVCSGEVLDSVFSADGIFQFNGTIEIPQYTYISNNRVVRQANLQCQFILEPGNLKMEPLPDFGEYVVRGSRANDRFADFAAKSAELTHYWEQNEGKEGVLEEVEAKYNKLLIDGTIGNCDNVFGLICLKELAYEQEPEMTRTLLNKFNSDMRKTKLWQSLDETNTKKLATSAGKQYMEFSQTDQFGNVISSKDVMTTPGTKYVLIDFWASWCGPCMREVPYLKETYSKYFSKGFQILGVSLDRSKDAWLKAVTDNQMNWIHVSDLKYWDNEVARQYSINSIPANFLIEASTGKIVATNLRGQDLEKKIAELLK